MPAADFLGDAAGGVCDLGPSAVVEGVHHVEARVACRLFLGDPHPIEHGRWDARVIVVADEDDSNAEFVEFVPSPFEQIDVELHEEGHFVGVPGPVLGRERIHGQPLEAEFEGTVDDVEQRRFPLRVPGGAGQATSVRPPAVAVQDDGHVSRDSIRDPG